MTVKIIDPQGPSGEPEPKNQLQEEAEVLGIFGNEFQMSLKAARSCRLRRAVENPFWAEIRTKIRTFRQRHLGKVSETAIRRTRRREREEESRDEAEAERTRPLPIRRRDLRAKR